MIQVFFSIVSILFISLDLYCKSIGDGGKSRAEILQSQQRFMGRVEEYQRDQWIEWDKRERYFASDPCCAGYICRRPERWYREEDDGSIV